MNLKSLLYLEGGHASSVNIQMIHLLPVCLLSYCKTETCPNIHIFSIHKDIGMMLGHSCCNQDHTTVIANSTVLHTNTQRLKAQDVDFNVGHWDRK